MNDRAPSLISFADGRFLKRRSAFRDQALASGLFSDVRVDALETLPSGFQDRFGDYMKSTPRGFGYWIWKPLIILEALKRAPSDGLVVYMDAGFTINPLAKDRFQEYLDIADAHPSGMLSFMNVFTESHWTKADLFSRLGLTLQSHEAKTSQLGSGLIIMKNTPDIHSLIAKWFAISIDENMHFSDDSPSSETNHPLFKEHRHDQSISSLLRKIHGTAVTHYEVQSYEGRFDALKNNTPAWATRLRS